MAAVDLRSTFPRIVARPSVTLTVNCAGSIHSARRSTSLRMASASSSSVRTYVLTMSARVTIPTRRSPSVTGSRLIRRSTISVAAALTGFDASMVIAGLVIESPAVRDSALAISCRVSSDSPKIRASGRCRNASGSCRLTSRSPSDTTPTTRPASSTTGSPLMRCSTSWRATSFSGVSGRTDSTERVITSRTVFIHLEPPAVAGSPGGPRGASDIVPADPTRERSGDVLRQAPRQAHHPPDAHVPEVGRGAVHERAPARDRGDPVLAAVADGLVRHAPTARAAVHPDAGDPQLAALARDGRSRLGRGPDDHGVHAARDRAEVVIAGVALDFVGVGVDREDLVPAVAEPLVDDVRAMAGGCPRHPGDGDTLVRQELRRRLCDRDHDPSPSWASAGPP